MNAFIVLLLIMHTSTPTARLVSLTAKSTYLKPSPSVQKNGPMSALPLIQTVGGDTFGKCNVENQRLFSVNARVSGEEARWASHYLSEMAKAIIDDVTLGLQDAP